jgi:acetoin utilization deacetylase AcuC-like enzyme
MSVALFTHPSALAHDTGEDHPECADRLRYVLRTLEGHDFIPLLREEAPKASIESLKAAHTATYVDFVLNLPTDRTTYIDGDTVFSPTSHEAALRSAGGATAAVDAVMEGWAQSAFVAMRPPGHHAEADRAMGFCFFNNAAVAAFHARNRWGLSRVAVLDFDVHHGNGTQDILGPEAGMFYGSSHQHPCYPGSGAPSERGVAWNVVNVQLPPGANGEVFRAGWENEILPALEAFHPELIIISAGFDGHAVDPMAQLRLREPDFVWVTQAIMAVADKCCPNRVVSLLEGGYDLSALASCTAAHVRTLMRL